MIGYKLFRVMKTQPGKLFPLYVFADEETPQGEWINAKCGELSNTGKVKSRLGELAFRPGWHLTDIPYAPHIGKKDKCGKIRWMKGNVVWCKCEYSDSINYQLEANNNGKNNTGKLIKKNAYLKHVPSNGFYRYKTNPNMYGEWVIAGSIKILEVLTDQQVNSILIENGINPMERYGGDIELKEYGFAV